GRMASPPGNAHSTRWLWESGPGPIKREANRSSAPVGLQPGPLGRQGHRTKEERAQTGTTHGRQVGPPLAGVVWLDMAGPTDGQRSQGGQVEHLVVDTRDLSVGINPQLHGWLHWSGAWPG